MVSGFSRTSQARRRDRRAHRTSSAYAPCTDAASEARQSPVFAEADLQVRLRSIHQRVDPRQAHSRPVWPPSGGRTLDIIQNMARWLVKEEPEHFVPVPRREYDAVELGRQNGKCRLS